jgi:hypothetical protein
MRAQKRDVHLPVAHPFNSLGPQTLVQGQRHQRECGPEGANGKRDERMKRRGRHDADAEASLLAAPGAPGRFKCAVILRQQRARMIEKHAPRFGQLDAARLAAQEHDIELALDCLDPLAQRRLLHTETLGRAGDVSFLRPRR